MTNHRASKLGNPALGRARPGLFSALVWLSIAALLPMASRATLPAIVDGKPLPSLSPMLEQTMPAVVNISTVTRIEMADHPLLRDPFFRHFFELPRQNKRQDSSLGSGVIVDASAGLVLTNHHVIAKADEIRVTLHDGHTTEAALVGTDPETDVALLRLPTDALPNTLSELPMADSDTLKVGDFVVAVGNPFGLSQTVTSGIVSGLGRSGLGIEGYESFIQTDASINPGNSGGPLVNLRGELVGINTAILAPGGGNIGIGFAIPINMARSIMEQILNYGEVRRGEFGLVVQELTPELARAFGVDTRHAALVSRVEPGSAAAAAGLAEGDVILKLDGREILGAADIRTRFGLLRAGTPVQLEILRSGRTLRVVGQIEDPYQAFIAGETLIADLAGALLGEPDERLSAVAVGPVRRGTLAWESGLREGDLIFQVNGERIGGLDDFAMLMRRDGGLYSLAIRRGDKLLRLSR